LIAERVQHVNRTHHAARLRLTAQMMDQSTNHPVGIDHAAHKDYTYSEKWISFLVEKVNSETEFAKIRSVKT
jgi:hypothetical protein